MAAEWQAQTVIKSFALKEWEKYNVVTANTLCLSILLLSPLDHPVILVSSVPKKSAEFLLQSK